MNCGRCGSYLPQHLSYVLVDVAAVVDGDDQHLDPVGLDAVDDAPVAGAPGYLLE